MNNPAGTSSPFDGAVARDMAALCLRALMYGLAASMACAVVVVLITLNAGQV